MKSTTASQIKVVRVWKVKLLDGGFMLYVPAYYMVR
jgi:hypothetical protein